MIDPYKTCCTIVLLAVLALSGCGGEEQVQLDDYLEELELDAPKESVTEVEIGSYRFSCAARHQNSSGRETEPVWVQVRFRLYAGAAHDDESAILAACERHRGMLDDAIITVFRKASIDELSDNRWAALRSKVIDTIRPLLGENRVRQIFFDDFQWEPI
ncbi:MAG: flagellar basal body-associated FliL family protein [Planctomycetales bacterium]|nr:flagellar basal body-associated FliL family protein [Planctomycetales bacterium]